MVLIGIENYLLNIYRRIINAFYFSIKGNKINYYTNIIQL
jgi:hypothetical protein